MIYTPKKIVERGLIFTIPLYQRLFEWNFENVRQLMEDLHRAFEQSASPTEGSGGNDYFIGMLTSAIAEGGGKRLHLVDGQQRFTVMTLIACVMQQYDPLWADFLLANGRPRLAFTSRRADDAYLQRLIQRDYDYDGELTNIKMKEAIDVIISFMDKLGEERASFAHYVYEHLCFFISELPQNYSAQDLNKYFERMNSSGKNLEHHEILKVKILSRLEGNISLYMQLWNRIADVDTILIRRKDYKDEKEYDFRSRKNAVLTASLSDIERNPQLVNSLKEESDGKSKSIKEIQAIEKKPEDAFTGHFNGSKSPLKFPQLLLQTLYYYLKKRDQDEFHPKLEDFFNQSKLLKTFQTYLPYEGAGINKQHLKDFFEQLLHCRVAMDVCFVRSLEYGFSLDMNLPEDNADLKELMMFESFLYVSSSNLTYYRWFEWLMNTVESVNGIPTPNYLFKELKEKCDSLNRLPEYDKLTFNEEIRYWFWRLDFYIWQHRKELFPTEDETRYLNIADNYVFIRNRSIEHVAPQTPMNNSDMKWDPDNPEDTIIRNSFGNLVMISQGLNSSLKNESYEIKREHVRAYINGSKTGSIESLKLLMIYRDYETKWDKEKILEHGKKMYALLSTEIRPAREANDT